MRTSEFILKFSDTVYIEKSLNSLVSNFLKNKLIDIQYLNAILAQNDFIALQAIGHQWKGTCASYGFNYLSKVGHQFEILGQHSDHFNLSKLIDSLPIYLKNIHIIFNDSTP